MNIGYPDTMNKLLVKTSTSPFKKAKLAKAWTQADRDAYNRKEGANLKPPQPGGGPRKKAYCARSAGIPKCKPSRRDKNGDCPNDIARRKWNC